MASNTSFFDYGQGIPPERTVRYSVSSSVPQQIARQMELFNVKSVNELYLFITEQDKQLDVLGQISSLYEDELARLQENITLELEKYGMIDRRCGPTTDPCASLPPHLIRK